MAREDGLVDEDFVPKSMAGDETDKRLKANRRRRTVYAKDYGAVRPNDNAYKPKPTGYKSSYT